MNATSISQLMMSTRQPWPVGAWRYVFYQLSKYAAWYSGDPEMLADRRDPFTPSGFWSQQVSPEQIKSAVHLPIAHDISGTNAALLFGEKPKICIPEAHGETVDPRAVKVEDRLKYIIEQNHFYSFLLEAAELCSAQGAVCIRLMWNRAVSDTPVFDAVQAMQCIPEFWAGTDRILKIWLWREVRTEENGAQYRILECHERGKITTQLFRGSIQAFGEEMDVDAIKRIAAGKAKDTDLLNACPLTDLAETATLEPVIETGLDWLAAWYIPNRKPHPKWPYLHIGRSDYYAQDSLFDSIDEVWSSWMRDIRLGLSRIIAPAQFFEQEERTNKFVFNLQKEAYLGLDALQEPSTGTNDNITLAQFKIRAEEHEKTIINLLKHCYSTAGYSPQTFGIHDEGRAESGAALDIRERKTWTTTALKALYWPNAIAQILYSALIIDRRFLGGPVDPMMPQVEMQDSMQSDYSQVVTCIASLSQARAASTEILVGMAHPDWDTARIMQEVDAIRTEDNAGAPDPTLIGRD